jgi:HK97 family phage major capsid protein/HK97 family phage prohead protease
MTKTRKIEGERLDRDFSINARDVDEEARTIELAFSSETGYERWFGEEVLSHESQSVRLGRLNDGGAVLVNHDTGDQVGVVESARIDDDRVGRAVIRFSKSQRGEEIFRDVADGIRKLVSVGYRIHKYSTEERKGQADLVTVTDWEPHEVSIVPVPADPSVGVGRSDEAKPNQIIEERTMPDETKAPEKKVEAPDIGKITAETRKAEQTRMKQIRSMADSHDLEDLGREAIDGDWSYEKFNQRALEKIGERNNQARVETKHDGNVDLSHSEQRDYSFARLMEAVANPQDRSAQQRAAFELEVSEAAVDGFGSNFKCRGVYIPDSVLSRTLNATTATDGPELISTDLMAGSFIDILRNNTVVRQAGATVLSGLVGNIAIPRQTAGAAMTWISAEDGDATESEPQFDQITMSPKDAACYTEATRRLTQQSTPAVEGLIQRDLAMAIALGTDLAGLYGSGAAGQPTGIANTVGINAPPPFAAADPTYIELTTMIKEVMKDNALMGSPQWIIDPEGWEALSSSVTKQAAGTEGNFVIGDSDRIKGYPYQVTNQVLPEDYFFGDFSQLLIGEWGGLELNVDPYTHSLKGRIRYVIFKTMDLVVRQPTAFCYNNDTI